MAGHAAASSLSSSSSGPSRRFTPAVHTAAPGRVQTHGTSVLAFEAGLWRQLGASPQNVTGRRVGILSWAEAGLGVWARERQREATSSVCHSLSHRDSGQLLAAAPSRSDKREACPGSVLERA